jgi:GNAT superfamily N-acetyltransferase
MNDDLRLRSAGAAAMLRSMHAGDLAVMHQLARQMSWPHRREDCAQLLGLGAGTVALDATGTTIGGGMRWAFGADVGTMGMVMVAREQQGKGIGRALMKALIAESGPRALMLNATAEGLRLYERLGFGPVSLVRQHQAQRIGGTLLPPAPVAALRRAVPADHASLCRLDAAVFGADRIELIGQLLADGETWLIERADRPCGFVVLRAFGHGMMIGPVLAPSEDEAIALVAAAVSAAPPRVLRVDIAARAENLARWLTAAGLPAVDTVTTMLRGRWPVARNETQRFGLAFQAVG